MLGYKFSAVTADGEQKNECRFWPNDKLDAASNNQPTINNQQPESGQEPFQLDINALIAFSCCALTVYVCVWARMLCECACVVSYALCTSKNYIKLYKYYVHLAKNNLQKQYDLQPWKYYKNGNIEKINDWKFR